jgi:hypothetical protein
MQPAASSVSVQLDYAAILAVPDAQVPAYAEQKAAQLAVISGLISDQTAGFTIELSDADMHALTSLASEMACLTAGLVGAIAGSAGNTAKGGA